MSDDKSLDLPARAPLSRMDEPKPTALTEKQKTKLIETGSRLLGDAGRIARDLIAIQKIRVTSAAKVDEIDADARRQADVIRAQVEKMRAGHDGVRTRGQEVRAIIAEVSAALSELSSEEDAAARRQLVTQLPRLAELAVGQGHDKP